MRSFMRSFMRLVLEALARRGGASLDYAPHHWGALELSRVEVPGPSLALASQNYFNATLSYMMSGDEFRSIRLDRSHSLRLVSRDFDLVRNRALGHRTEGIYRVEVRFCVGDLADGSPARTGPRLLSMLASDYDRIMAELGAVPVS